MSTNAAPSGPSNASQTEPNVAGVKVRPGVAMVLYGLLVAAAAVAMWAQQAPDAPPMVARTAPWLFLAFALGFAGYRIALVAARKYSAFKAFFQIFVAALFFMLLLLPRAPALVPGELPALLNDADPKVRSLAAEVAGWRGDASTGHTLAQLLTDSSPVVRQSAHAALVKLNHGADLGAPDDAAARTAWQERFK